MPTSVSLSARFESFVQEHLKSRRYNNVSEGACAWLRAAIAAGLASGNGKPAEAVFDRLETKYRKRQGKRAT